MLIQNDVQSIASFSGRRKDGLVWTDCACATIPRKTWESVYVWKWSVKSIRIHPIYFQIIKRLQVIKCFLVHVGYLETCQCCVSLLLRSLSFHSSLSTLPTQEWQLCVGRTFTISTSMRSTRAVEKANLSAIPHHGREQWNTWLALLNDRFDRKVLQLL